jgi:hypothetical protein
LIGVAEICGAILAKFPLYGSRTFETNNTILEILARTLRKSGNVLKCHGSQR